MPHKDIDKRKAYNKAYYQSNKDKKKEYLKAYYEANKDKIKEYANIYTKKRLQTDDLFSTKIKIRNLIRQSLRRKGYKKDSRTEQILGIDINGFKKHIESQFKDGMTWKNKGQWHIDHIYPLALAKTKEEVIKLNHYTNLQPLWGIENIKKGAKVTGQTKIIL